MATTTGRPPLWRDVRVLAWTFQIAVVLVVVAIVFWLLDNLRVNSQRLNIPTGFGHLDQPSSFPIPGSDFRQTQPVRDALVEGFQNTLRLAITGIALATVAGVLIGIARLSQNFIVRSAARAYVEFVRNVPLFCLLFVMYGAVVLNAFPRVADSWDVGPVAIVNVRGASTFWFEGGNWKFVVALLSAGIVAFLVARWRSRIADRTGTPGRTGLWALPTAAVVLVVVWIVLGLGATAPEIDGARVTGGITMTPEYFAALAALVIYTSSHVAEIVRGSIQAVPRGQGEAANALALSGFQRLWHVVLPQAMRIGVPPIGNQYLNLAKNSSLAAAISFPELTKVTQLTVANRSPAVPSFALLLGIYLVLSLVISLFVNLANRRLAIVER
ncbi:MAG: ABC transporter permease subunit [Acidimicrobiia bacterium]|nr:ABC transporter permease subunit [Acidimicrobiia bacterium]